MNDRFIIDETTNTLIECRHSVRWERLDYLIIPHQYNGKQIDHIGPHCFDFLIINLHCIEEGVKYLDDCALENSWVLNVKLPRGLKIGERCFAGSQLMEILLPRDLHTIKRETFKNCSNLETISAQFGVTSISYGAFAGCVNLKEAHFRIIRSVKDYAFDSCVSLQTLDLSADSLYIPPDCFQGALCLKEITVGGNFEPIVEKRSCFPENVIIKGYFDSTPLKILSFDFDYEVIA